MMRTLNILLAALLALGPASAHAGSFAASAGQVRVQAPAGAGAAGSALGGSLRTGVPLTAPGSSLSLGSVLPSAASQEQPVSRTPAKSTTGRQLYFDFGRKVEAAPVRPAGPTDEELRLSRSVFSKMFDEDPSVLAHFRQVVDNASFRPLMQGIDSPEGFRDYMAGNLPYFMHDFFTSYAHESGESVERLLAWAASDSADAADVRRSLSGMLRGHTSARSEAWTYIFRDSELWESDLRRYLQERIQEKKALGRMFLDLDSVGAAYGAEPYTLAITVYEELVGAGEDPKAWDVGIRAYDISVLSLLSMKEGIYRSPEGGGYYIPEHTLKRLEAEKEKGHFKETGIEKLSKVDETLRGWIKPSYADLNDARQHRPLRETNPDVVFANYFLTHLRLKPAGELAEHWLRGDWSSHGFLSMAQTMVAEVFKDTYKYMDARPLASSMSLLRRFALTVGAIGASFYGDSRAKRPRLYDRFFRHRSRAGRKVFRLNREFLAGLSKDPFETATLSPRMTDEVEHLVAETGLRPVLMTDDVLMAADEEGLHLNVGWLLRDDSLDDKARKKLLRRMWREQAGRASRTEYPGGAFFDPRWGPGHVLFGGDTLEGAHLKAVRFRDGTARLIWLVPGKLAPITDDYKDEKPSAKPQPSPYRIRVTM